ncbi:MAG: hypothetical protein V1933_03020 [Candidatus Omnitrophota bacterium]
MRIHAMYVFILLAILVVTLYSPVTSYLLKDLVISKLEKNIGMNIVFDKARFEFPARLIISEAKAVDKKGLAFISRYAAFQLDMAKIFLAEIKLNCSFQDVSVKSELGNMLNSALGSLGVPFRDSYNFDSVTGAIILRKGFFSVRDLRADGPEFKFFGRLNMFNGKKVDYDIECRINKSVIDSKSAKDNLLLGDESEDGWYLVRLALKGDPRRPSNVSFSAGGIKLELRPAVGR